MIFFVFLVITTSKHNTLPRWKSCFRKLTKKTTFSKPSKLCLSFCLPLQLHYLSWWSTDSLSRAVAPLSLSLPPLSFGAKCVHDRNRAMPLFLYLAWVALTSTIWFYFSISISRISDLHFSNNNTFFHLTFFVQKSK